MYLKLGISLSLVIRIFKKLYYLRDSNKCFSIFFHHKTYQINVIVSNNQHYAVRQKQCGSINFVLLL